MPRGRRRGLLTRPATDVRHATELPGRYSTERTATTLPAIEFLAMFLASVVIVHLLVMWRIRRCHGISKVVMFWVIAFVVVFFTVACAEIADGAAWAFVVPFVVLISQLLLTRWW